MGLWCRRGRCRSGCRHDRYGPRARGGALGAGGPGPAAAPAMIGMAGAPVGRADTPDDVLDQAIKDLTQAAQVLEQAPQASLDAHVLAALTPEENLIGTSESFASALEADQAGLPAADQAGLAD